MAAAMTVHYHGGPITPASLLHTLAGRNFCVSHAAPHQVETVHKLGQSVMLDNGAFSAWKRGYQPDWESYHAWCNRWLDFPTTWAVIPDVIEGDEDAQDELIRAWPHGNRGAPVWHMHEGVERLLRLLDEWPRVCIGSSAQYAKILSSGWVKRMDLAWREIGRRHSRTPNVHMLRGMQLVTCHWPFASVDSTDVARNHNRPQNTPAEMAMRWDAAQCPPAFIDPPQQMELAA
jgi:hypothetical protein